MQKWPPDDGKLFARNMLRIFISEIKQLDAQNLLFYNMLISCLYMFRAHVLIIIMRSKLHYTASGIITPIGVQFWPPDDEHMVLETCRGMK